MSWAEAIKTSNTVKSALQASKEEIITNTDDEAKLTNDYLLAMILLDGSGYDNFVAQDELLLKRLLENEELKKDVKVLGKIIDAITAVGNPIFAKGKQGEVMYWLTGDERLAGLSYSSEWSIFTVPEFRENFSKPEGWLIIEGLCYSSIFRTTLKSINGYAGWGSICSYYWNSVHVHTSTRLMSILRSDNISYYNDRFSDGSSSDIVASMIGKLRHSYDDMYWILSDSKFLFCICRNSRALAKFIVCSKETPSDKGNIRWDFWSKIASSADVSASTLDLNTGTYFDRPNAWNDNTYNVSAPYFKLFNSQNISGSNYTDEALLIPDYSIMTITEWGCVTGFGSQIKMVEKKSGIHPNIGSSQSATYSPCDWAVIGGAFMPTDTYNPNYVKWTANLYKVKESKIAELQA